MRVQLQSLQRTVYEVKEIILHKIIGRRAALCYNKKDYYDTEQPLSF